MSDKTKQETQIAVSYHVVKNNENVKSLKFLCHINSNIYVSQEWIVQRSTVADPGGNPAIAPNPVMALGSLDPPVAKRSQHSATPPKRCTVLGSLVITVLLLHT